MHSIVPLILVFSLGFLAAIPAGPVQVEVVKRSIHGHLMTSFVVIFGAFLVDIFYGIVALFGIARFLERPGVASVFWFIGSIILGILGFLTIRHSRPGSGVRGEPQFLMLASDGELYGHHKTHRDYFLARLVDGGSEAAGLHTTFRPFG